MKAKLRTKMARDKVCCCCSILNGGKSRWFIDKPAAGRIAIAFAGSANYGGGQLF